MFGIGTRPSTAASRSAVGAESSYGEEEMSIDQLDAEIAEEDSCAGVHKYLERHQIPLLLDMLLAQAVLERPEDLRAFLIGVLSEMKLSRGAPSTGPFTEEDLETMFDMWDVLKTGLIPATKLVEQFRALQLGPRAESAVCEAFRVHYLEELEHVEVDKDTFVRIVRSELAHMFSSSSFIV